MKSNTITVAALALIAVLYFLLSGKRDQRPRTISANDIVAAADSGARFLTASGYQADFSPASIRRVEAFFDDQTVGPEQPKPGGLLETDTLRRVFIIGAYVGEVIRRNVGGEWIVDPTGPDAEWHATLRRSDDSMCWPIEKVAKRFFNGSEDGLVFYAMQIGVNPGPSSAQ